MKSLGVVISKEPCVQNCCLAPRRHLEHEASSASPRCDKDKNVVLSGVATCDCPAWRPSVSGFSAIDSGHGNSATVASAGKGTNGIDASPPGRPQVRRARRESLGIAMAVALRITMAVVESAGHVIASGVGGWSRCEIGGSRCGCATGGSRRMIDTAKIKMEPASFLRPRRENHVVITRWFLVTSISQSRFRSKENHL